MSKYIIKNCPAYCYLGKECHNEESKYGASCCEITDCVLKQIVELCRKAPILDADWILNKLDIQEVE